MISTISRKSLAAGPPGTIQFPRVSAQRYVLPNGLILLVQEDRSAPVASVQAWVGTGSIHEGQHVGAGLSHLLEHMLFKGTETRSTNAIAQSVQDEGGYINAYTSFDRTVYWIDVPKAGLHSAIDLLADACMNSTLPADEFVKEQEVIRREFAMVADDPDRVNSQQLFTTAYREHPYRHPVIGHLDIFNALTRDDLMAYYKARYVPEQPRVRGGGRRGFRRRSGTTGDVFSRPIRAARCRRSSSRRSRPNWAGGCRTRNFQPSFRVRLCRGTSPISRIPTCLHSTCWPRCWATGAVRASTSRCASKNGSHTSSRRFPTCRPSRDFSASM